MLFSKNFENYVSIRFHMMPVDNCRWLVCNTGHAVTDMVLIKTSVYITDEQKVCFCMLLSKLTYFPWNSDGNVIEVFALYSDHLSSVVTSVIVLLQNTNITIYIKQ